jgi:Protein kinase domain
VKGLVYFVMGYVRGESLAARVKRSGRIGVEETRHILAEVTDALAYAHAQGIVHRDIKPDNILIDADSGRAMLTDFGVAKALSLEGTLTATGLVVGTPHYMSPEQAAGRSDIDGRSDIYSLGVMGYAMLAGRLPFGGKTPAEVLVQHLTKEPPPLQALAPEAPYALVAALMRCLAKDPADRWQEARDFKVALVPDDSVPALPAKVRALSVCLQGLFVMLLLRAYVWLSLAADPSQTSNSAFLREPIEKFAFVFAGAGLFTAIQTRRQLKLSWPAILRFALLQPSWWPGWHPRRLRRPGDLWDRLPSPIRVARHLVGIFLVALALVVTPLAIALGASGAYYERTGTTTRIGALVLNLANWYLLPLPIAGLAAFTSVIRATLWLRRRLGAEYEFEFDEMPVLGATWKKGSPWQRPAYRALLRPAAADADVPKTEADLERAVHALADALPRALADVAPAIRTAARSLRGTIAIFDHEIATLAADLDPQEAARLEGKLAALGPTSVGDPSGRQQLRDLLAQQLALLQGISARLESASRERAERVELLRALWQQLRRVADEPPREATTNARTVEQLRALCAEIERRSSRIAAPTQGDVSELPTLEQ